MRPVTVAVTGPAAPAGHDPVAGQARKRHTQARAIARDLSTDPEETRALERLGRCHLQHATPAKAPRTCGRHSRSASATEPRARRVQTTFDNHRLAATAPEPLPANPDSKGHQPRTSAGP